MKYFLLIMLLSTMVFSCKKEKNLGPLYESFIGVWKPIYGNEGDYIEFTKNGYFIYSRGIERQVNYPIEEIIDFGSLEVNGVDWNLAVFTPSVDNMSIVYNDTKDTISRYPRNFLNEQGDANFTLGNQFFVRQ